MQCANIFGDEQCPREARWNSNLCTMCGHDWEGHKDKLEDLNFKSARAFIPRSDKLTPKERTSIMSLGKKPKPIKSEPLPSLKAPQLEPVETRQLDHELLTLREVASYFSVSTMTIKRWGKQGKLKAIRINSRGDRRYLRSEIERILGGKK